MTETNEPKRDFQLLNIDQLLQQLAGITYDNEFFSHGEKDDLITIGKKLAIYVHDNNISRVAFLDTSARPAYLCLREAWKRLYPNQESPRMYFVNPTGFNTEATLQETEIAPSGKSLPRFATIAARRVPDELGLIQKEEEFQRLINSVIDVFFGRTTETVQQDLKASYRGLIANPNEPVLVFDTCLHTGMSMGVVIDALRQAGMSDIRVGLASHSRNYSNIAPDFVALEHDAQRGCYPFDRDSMIKKTLGELNSGPAQRAEDKDRGRRLRKTITQIFETAWK